MNFAPHESRLATWKFSSHRHIHNAKRAHEVCANNYSITSVLSGHSKINKANVLKTNGSLMKIKKIAECSKRAYSATLLTCMTMSDKGSWKPIFGLLSEWLLKTGFTVLWAYQVEHGINFLDKRGYSIEYPKEELILLLNLTAKIYSI